MLVDATTIAARERVHLGRVLQGRFKMNHPRITPLRRDRRRHNILRLVRPLPLLEPGVLHVAATAVARPVHCLTCLLQFGGGGRRAVFSRFVIIKCEIIELIIQDLDVIIDGALASLIDGCCVKVPSITLSDRRRLLVPIR